MMAPCPIRLRNRLALGIGTGQGRFSTWCTDQKKSSGCLLLASRAARRGNDFSDFGTTSFCGARGEAVSSPPAFFDGTEDTGSPKLPPVPPVAHFVDQGIGTWALKPTLPLGSRRKRGLNPGLPARPEPPPATRPFASPATRRSVTGHTIFAATCPPGSERRHRPHDLRLYRRSEQPLGMTSCR